MGVYHLPRSAVELLRQRYARQLGERDLYPDAREWRYDGRVVDLVFTTPTGGLVLRQSIAKTLQRCARTAGISTEDLATHTGRRTLVSTLEAAGVARALVSDAVGHSDQATTETYVHRDHTRSREVSAIAARLLDPKRPGDT